MVGAVVDTSSSEEGLRELSDNELLARLRAAPRGSPERAVICDIVVRRYAGLVQSCVRRYRRSPEPFEDLLQVGYVGLVKAVNSFDPAVGTAWPPTPRRV
jgi:DNA-directed RNA polymerase specialized sigma subunit